LFDFNAFAMSPSILNKIHVSCLLGDDLLTTSVKYITYSVTVVDCSVNNVNCIKQNIIVDVYEDLSCTEGTINWKC